MQKLLAQKLLAENSTFIILRRKFQLKFNKNSLKDQL